MDKADLEEFVRYYNMLHCGNYHNVIDHMYERFGHEFIHKLPTECRYINKHNRLVIQGTVWEHSTTEPSYVYNNKPEFYILGYWLPLDRWLPLSALSPEDITLFKLKYG